MSDLNKKTAGKYLFKLMYSDWVVEVSIKRALNFPKPPNIL